MRKLLRATGARTKADVKALSYGAVALVMSVAIIAIFTLVA